jgi:hypothetical protein
VSPVTDENLVKAFTGGVNWGNAAQVGREVVRRERFVNLLVGKGL